MVLDVPAHRLLPGVELLGQALLPRLQRGLHIVTGGLLGPEGQHPQERSGQRGLLVLRKARGAELLDRLLGRLRVGQRRRTGVRGGDRREAFVGAGLGICQLHRLG
jgi:hypothetical protein